jgi:phosphoribosylanthranilate isomerase
LGHAAEVVELCDALGASVVQLHGDIDASELRKIRQKHPRLAIIKSLVIGLHSAEKLLEIVERTAPLVDAYITDTFDPRTGATGATGKTHDWRASEQLVSQSPRPVILAGGLHPGNVRAAISRFVRQGSMRIRAWRTHQVERARRKCGNSSSKRRLRLA